jgi:pimeloyl-ACP methyl ester carboxylesterase
MGGKTAMQFALQFPGKVEKLVVADMAPRAYAPAREKIFTALLALDLKSFLSRQEIEDALAPEIPDLILRRFLLKNLGRKSGGEFFWKINLRGIAENYLQLREPVFAPVPFAKPALFIRGERSDYISAADEPLIHGLFPLSEIQTIVSAGHWIHADKPEKFLECVLKFLAD